MPDNILCPNKFGVQKGVFQKCSLDLEPTNINVPISSLEVEPVRTQERIMFGLILFHRTLQFDLGVGLGISLTTVAHVRNSQQYHMHQ